VLFLKDLDNREDKLFYFGGIDKARFRRPVVPGDQLILELDVLQQRAQSARLRGVGRVDGKLVAEAEMMSIMADRPE
jgi:3-hydroxyacyl-[acyl-carrier-protein] dehydratase